MEENIWVGFKKRVGGAQRCVGAVAVHWDNEFWTQSPLQGLSLDRAAVRSLRLGQLCPRGKQRSLRQRPNGIVIVLCGLWN